MINPPYPFEESPSPPFGPMSIAAFLLENGIEVRIEDYVVRPCTIERIREVAETFRPDIVGSTAVTMNVKRALRILDNFRDALPGVITVMGGPHVTFDADNILRNSGHVDFVVRGEGEITLLELIKALADKSHPGGVRGISFREGDEVVHTGDRELIPDINILPFPARHLVEHSKYRALGFPVNMVTSRGCPFNCIFCVGSKMVGRRVRYFNTDRVVNEFAMLAEYGFSQINIADDLFTANASRCIDICREIVRRGVQYPWTAFARVDTVTGELLSAMKESGCTTLCFGIESGNQQILDAIKKKTNLAMCRKAVDLCLEAGIRPMTSYILGLPGETPDTVRATMEFARELSPWYGYHILAPFPGTEVREKSAEYGMRILTDDWDLYDANRSVCESVSMPGTEVDRIVNEFNNDIDMYVASSVESYERGEELDPERLEMVRKIKSTDFCRMLIMDRIVETYPRSGYNGGGPGISDFVAYVSDRTGLKKEDAGHEIERLVRIGSLQMKRVDAGAYMSWV